MSAINEMLNLQAEIERFINEFIIHASDSDANSFMQQKRIQAKLIPVGDQENKFMFLIACDQKQALIFDPDEEDFGVGKFSRCEFLTGVELIGPLDACVQEFYKRREIE
jgi:hypothetical protein